MRQPLLNRHPVEIGLDPHDPKVIAVIEADATYPRQFAAAFAGDGTISVAHVIKAIATFERTLLDGSSPFDAYVFAGQHDALSAGAKRGMALFFSARVGCAGCHSGFNFSGNWRDDKGATGRPSFADDGLGAGPMRVPTLRNIALTAPYMHDGRFATLAAVLAHYQRVGKTPDSAHGGQRDPRLKSFTLDATERADLEAFLDSLTGRAVAAALAADPQSG
jgi:cytochrome c peroxidase